LDGAICSGDLKEQPVLDQHRTLDEPRLSAEVEDRYRSGGGAVRPPQRQTVGRVECGENERTAERR
jgi:hypothetical protein